MVVYRLEFLLLAVNGAHNNYRRYWAAIGDALRTAAYNRGVSVRLMGSYWNHTSEDMIKFLASLSANSGIGPLNGSIETVSLRALHTHTLIIIVCTHFIYFFLLETVQCPSCSKQKHSIHTSQSQQVYGHRQGCFCQ